MARHPSPASFSGLLSRLARDRGGNTLMLVAAALLPLLGMLGGGVDMGRAYVTQTRLQQACDAAVLAARKKLGSDLPPSDQVVGKVRKTGNDFFDLNFERGRYGTTGRSFQMTLEADYSISGTASVDLPTTIMGIFGFQNIPVDVECQARMNFTNLDIMMAIDVSGSMRITNPGDSMSRLDSVRQVVRGFHGDLNLTKAPGTRIRFGFVPYASNVNVGNLLRNNWVVNQWTYQSREDAGQERTERSRTYATNWQYRSGNRTPWTETSRFDATYHPAQAGTPGTGDGGGSGGSSAYYTCDGSAPANAWSYSDVKQSENQTAVNDPPGTRTEEIIERINNGTRYRIRRDGDQCLVEQQTDNGYVETYSRITEPYWDTRQLWRYAPIVSAVGNWRNETAGCIEERSTYEILDYDNVDLSQAIDLDIDRIPDSSDPDTQWRPRYPGRTWTRAVWANGTGQPQADEITTSNAIAQTSLHWISSCGAAARRLTELSTSDLNTYLATLSPQGSTYHDIGMIWAGRLISPTGLFASENADESRNRPTSRHVIFLTDGQTEPLDITYGAYGIEGIEGRRWSSSSSLTLKETVEARFGFACNEVKKRNTTVWIIAFGTDVNPTMQECAGPGRYFEANDSAQLEEAFSAITRSLGDLRISE